MDSLEVKPGAPVNPGTPRGPCEHDPRNGDVTDGTDGGYTKGGRWEARGVGTGVWGVGVGGGGVSKGVKIRKRTGTGIAGTFPREAGAAGRARGVGAEVTCWHKAAVTTARLTKQAIVNSLRPRCRFLASPSIFSPHAFQPLPDPSLFFLLIVIIQLLPPRGISPFPAVFKKKTIKKTPQLSRLLSSLWLKNGASALSFFLSLSLCVLTPFSGSLKGMEVTEGAGGDRCQRIHGVLHTRTQTDTHPHPTPCPSTIARGPHH